MGRTAAVRGEGGTRTRCRHRHHPRPYSGLPPDPPPPGQPPHLRLRTHRPSVEPQPRNPRHDPPMARVRRRPLLLPPLRILRHGPVQPHRYHRRFLRGQSKPRLHGRGCDVLDRILGPFRRLSGIQPSVDALGRRDVGDDGAGRQDGGDGDVRGELQPRDSEAQEGQPRPRHVRRIPIPPPSLLLRLLLLVRRHPAPPRQSPLHRRLRVRVVDVLPEEDTVRGGDAGEALSGGVPRVSGGELRGDTVFEIG
mmetsp:Transcript_5912/g.12339  ORF Transcript_5912/g.12339 Transcript_5912/m.12339 type:complete len:251 (+) Transcript_5912:475-1227(+)